MNEYQFKKYFSKKSLEKMGQVTVEFSFSLVIVVLLMFGLIKVLSWVGTDLGERRAAHENALLTEVNEKWTPGMINAQGPPAQLNTNFYKTKKLRAVFNGDF